MTDSETSQLLASRGAPPTPPDALHSQEPAKPPFSTAGPLPILQEHRSDAPHFDLTDEQIKILADSSRMPSQSEPSKPVDARQIACPSCGDALFGGKCLNPACYRFPASAPVPAKLPGAFWQAVTWDLHLTASSLIIFLCLAIAEFWTAEAPHFLKLAALATTYLIGNSAGKTLPGPKDPPGVP